MRQRSQQSSARPQSGPAIVTPAAAAAAGRLAALVFSARSGLLLILAGALCLRLYGMGALITYYPDSYAQQRATENLLSGEFPVSFYYPPGLALVFAPFFLVLPDTLETMQAVVLIAGAALVVLSYVMMSAVTGDRRIALSLALAVAVGSPFVFYSRVLFFDVINTLLIAAALLLAPVVMSPRRPMVASYGLLVFMMVTVRYTNVIVLPALLLASLNASPRPLSWRLLRDQAFSRSVLLVLVVVIGLLAVYIGTSYGTLNRFGGAEDKSGSIFDFGSYLPRLGQYAISSFIGYDDPLGWEDGVAAAAVACLAAVGALRLWRNNRAPLLAVLYLLAVWSPVHAVYEIFVNRYAMPSFFFVLALAATGLVVSVDCARSRPLLAQRVGMAAVLALAVSLILARQAAVDFGFLCQWPERTALSRERSYDDIRSALATLASPEPVLLSSQALAVDRANPDVTTYDLLRHSETYGINDDSIQRLLALVDASLRGGKTVVYHYTEFEDERSHFRKYEQSFDAYFEALSQRFVLREIVSAPDRPQRLYVIDAAPQ